MNRLASFTVLGVLFAALSASGASAPGINPSADAFVSSANSTSNYGSAGALSVASGSLSNGEFDSFIRFNLASTKTYFDSLFGANSYTIQSVTLQLTSSSPNNPIFDSPSAMGSFQIQLTSNSTEFIEGNGTPSSSNTVPGAVTYSNEGSFESSGDPGLGTQSFPGGTTGNNIYTLTLASGLVADIQSGSDVGLYLSPADSKIAYVFNSNNFGTVTSRPVLTVNAIANAPEPRTMTLLLAAVAFTAAAIRRRKSVL